jgi:hypothetical protein
MQTDGKISNATPTARQLQFTDVEKWEIPPLQGNAVAIDALPAPIWTETKAQLIANYLRLFPPHNQTRRLYRRLRGPTGQTEPRLVGGEARLGDVAALDEVVLPVRAGQDFVRRPQGDD